MIIDVLWTSPDGQFVSRLGGVLVFLFGDETLSREDVFSQESRIESPTFHGQRLIKELQSSTRNHIDDYHATSGLTLIPCPDRVSTRGKRGGDSIDWIPGS